MFSDQLINHAAFLFDNDERDCSNLSISKGSPHEEEKSKTSSHNLRNIESGSLIISERSP